MYKINMYITATLLAVAPGFCMQEEYAPIKRDELKNHILQNYVGNKKTPIEEVVNIILDRSFEKERREVQSSKNGFNFGYVFPTQPEIMSDLIDFIQKFKEEKKKGPCVLEIGGGPGDNAILLGVSGADYVLHNDLEEKETSAFKDTVKKLPESFRKKFNCMTGDIFLCLPMLTKSDKKFDLVLMRNVIHFFKKDQREKFFNLLKPILNHGATICMTTNGILDLKEKKAQGIGEKIAFRYDNFMIGMKIINSSAPIGCAPWAVTEEKTTLVPGASDIQTENLINILTLNNIGKKDITEGNWQKLSIDSITKWCKEKKVYFKKEIKETLEKSLNVFGTFGQQNLHHLDFGVSSQLCYHYTPTQLSELVANHGFIIQKEYNIQDDGHANPKGVNTFSGIIAKYDEKK